MANLTLQNPIKKLEGSVSKTILLLMASVALGFGGGWLGAGSRERIQRLDSTSLQRQYISSESQLIAKIAKDVGASVVSINTTSQSTVQDFFGFNRSTSQESAGTGFIVSNEGVIVTNRHVVPQGTTNVSVTLSDGTRLDGVELIGRTSSGDNLDVAFLKIKDAKGKKLIPAKLGDSSKMQVGERVVAIGNALGQFQNSVTSGIISGHSRDIVASDESSGDTEALTNLFQTDAAINQGNSGGPLVNMSGEVIGVNTATAGASVQNIGFAIPINDIKGLIDGVLQTGQLLKPYLGVRYVSITDDLAYQLNLSVNRGAYLVPAAQNGGQAAVVTGSPAAKAGLREKDIITKVNDTKIDNTTSLSSALNHFKVGANITLTIMRDGKTQQIKVTLQSSPQS